MQDEPAGRLPRRLLFACVFFCFAATLNTQTFGLLLTRIASDTRMSIPAIGGLRTLENVATIVVAVLVAPHADRYPRRLPLATGFVCAIVAALTICAFPTSAGVAVYLMLNGAAVLLCISTTLAIPGDFLTDRGLHRAMGFMIAGFSLSEIVFLPVAGSVATRFGWRSGFLLTSAVLVGALLLALLLAPRSVSSRRRSDDISVKHRYRRFAANNPLMVMLGSAVTRFAQYTAIATFLAAILVTRFDLRIAAIGAIFSLVGATSFSGSAVSGFLVGRERFRLALTEVGLIIALLIVSAFAANPGVVATIALTGFVMFGLSLQENVSTLAVLDLSQEGPGAATSLNELSAAAGALTGIGLGSIGLAVAGVTGFGAVMAVLALLGSIGSRAALRRGDRMLSRTANTVSK